MDKSIKAVLAGLGWWLFWGALFGGVAGAAGAALGGSGQGIGALFSATFIWVLLAGNLVATFVGAWITARRAPGSPLTHALAFGAIVGLLSMGWAMPGFVREVQFLGAVIVALVAGSLASD